MTQATFENLYYVVWIGTASMLTAVVMLGHVLLDIRNVLRSIDAALRKELEKEG